jgi:hypothetical protein
MIVNSLCNTCYQVYEIRSEPEDTHLLKELMREDLTATCPRLCGGRINIVSSVSISALAQDPRLRPPLPISVRELFKAVKGAGLPDEIPKSYEFVEALFKSTPVKSVSLEQDGNRIYLHEVHFENGSVLHLSAGLRGAQVLKITKEKA